MSYAGTERPRAGPGPHRLVELEFAPPAPPEELCDRLRTAGDALLLDGGGVRGAWRDGALLAIAARPVLRLPATASPLRRRRALAALGRLVREARAAGGGRGTGVAALLSYDFWEPPGRAQGEPPALLAWRVDRSLRFHEEGRALWSGIGPADDARRWIDRWGEQGRRSARTPRRAPRASGQPRTSLPREAYRSAVGRLRRQIAAGEIYQANLCQQFRVEYEGDPFELYRELRGAHAAAHSAYVQTADVALVSASPETFLRVSADRRIETWPIKGTRARRSTLGADRAAADELWGSEKDRAELTMIVDLERNDLGRVAVAGSVRFRGLELRTLATVHHLVGRVEATLRRGVGAARLIGATFPGGSISGAPKIRAMRLLREIEPVPRGLFTGSLLWFADDGSMDSSILIRSVVFDSSHARIGAGGGIVADSDPEAEWAESNQKARFLAAALGFAPEQAV